MEHIVYMDEKLLIYNQILNKGIYYISNKVFRRLLMHPANLQHKEISSLNDENSWIRYCYLITSSIRS